MSYRITLSKPAQKQFRKLPKDVQGRLLLVLRGLETDPRPPGVKKLVGTERAWRVRAGDYRIIYEIFDGELVVDVIRLGHRREVYL